LDEDSILSAYEAGACDYILKGVSAKEIVDAVEAAARHNQFT
jgi:DNA-binding NarL/FixJ family response regulator